ncbi:uncharacterized protein BKA55DRAFT_679077 [Fusarium redolens]|uniref:Uncharacterized protein n=1 Tax=Fusarium redolens TaxID=48865 RepID=A0A9P9GBZ8_FUSRE|nr:uncharacterized protein BKA55DRAFT_679077 [Fusarium redolens]KAH7236763.1 hypothetical protein BKA55DRAFT_679077 [Fusarium redolens]
MDGPSRLTVPGRVPDKRYSLFDIINRIDVNDEDEIFQLVTNLDEHAEDSHNFRWQSVGTQKSQDRVRFNYRHFLQTIKLISEDITEEDIDKEMFLGDKEKITKQLKIFIMFVAKYGCGRAQGSRISYHGLVVYCNALIFWHNRMAKTYNESPLPRSTLFAITTEAMRYATQVFQLPGTAKMDMSKIKPEFLDKPVFLAAGPRGLKITQEPMRATALTTYVSLRGQKIGYSQGLTFYSFRRRAATDLTRKIGNDAARSLMNHDPDFRTLEKFYLWLEDTLDVSGLALDEVDGDTGGHTEEMLKSGNDLAIHVLTDERARKIHGPALNALMSQMMLGDENYPVLASPKELRNYKRVDQRREMSQTDYNERVRRLERSRHGELVLKKARRNLAAPEPMDEGESPSDETPTVVDQTTGLFIHDVEELPEQDLDNQIDNIGDNDVIHRELDEGEPEANEDIPYIEAAKALMQLILDNTMSEYRNLRKNGVPCPQCRNNKTISQELKICNTATPS